MKNVASRGLVSRDGNGSGGGNGSGSGTGGKDKSGGDNGTDGTNSGILGVWDVCKEQLSRCGGGACGYVV